MAILRPLECGHQPFVLPDPCVVGRSPACDLVLGARDVSGQHAVLRFCGTHWEVCDLASRNGTHVDGVRLARGARARVRKGAHLRFGRELPGFELVDASEPQPMARNLVTDEVRVGEDHHLDLSRASGSDWRIHQDALGTWVAERSGQATVLADRAVLPSRRGHAWRVYLPRACGGTWGGGDEAPDVGPTVADLSLRFACSRDEEHVELLARAGERTFDLGSRVHHYPLLVLARRRLADRTAGVAAGEQGWLPHCDLLRMLRVDDNHLNIMIHRARTQLRELGVADAAALVERRTTVHQLRIGVARLELPPCAGPTTLAPALSRSAPPSARTERPARSR
jgi:hypothetical protein